jgi:protein-export membrane protein SecD
VLGLDLQGGAHLLMGVDTDQLRKERLVNLRDDLRKTLTEAPRIGYTGLNVTADGVQVRLREGADVADARARIKKMTQPAGSLLGLSAQVIEIDLSEPEAGQFVLKLTEAGINERVRSAVDQSLEVIRRRIDISGTTEPVIARQGRDRILIQVPGLQDPEQLKRLLGSTAKLAFRLIDNSMSVEQAKAGRAPIESEILPSKEGLDALVEKRVIVAGEDLIDAQGMQDQRTNEWVVSFKFNLSGSRKFAQVTQESVGRPFAIVLDDKVISAPVIREPIIGGSGQISGSFNAQSANELAILLRAGALPVKLIALEERTVGPGLGADSIEAGKIAAYVATALVGGFMIATYGFLGLLACIALIIHVAFIFAGMSLVGATLTLPGIAGIVLTIGMAVDSNVLIYERIREEVHLGKSPLAAIETGFTRALGTIWDANITQMIATVILFLVGTGPVRGFAVTLAIGIMTTVFTAVTLVRLMVAVWVRIKRPTHIPL